MTEAFFAADEYHAIEGGCQVYDAIWRKDGELEEHFHPLEMWQGPLNHGLAWAYCSTIKRFYAVWT